MKFSTIFSVLLLGLLLALAAFGANEDDVPKIVFIVGKLDDHPPGTHEYEKATAILAEALKKNSQTRVETHFGGWPDDPATLDDADTIVLVSGGADREEAHHPFLVGDRLKVIERQMKRGCGLAVIHWGVFVPAKKAGAHFLDWIGGFFDYQSGPRPRRWVGAIQTTEAKLAFTQPKHPIVENLEPFTIRDEWYYHMTLAEEAVPLVQIRLPNVDAPQTIAFAVDRADGGRGFGFTGGHFLENYRHREFQRLLLNALLWTARAEPSGE